MALVRMYRDPALGEPHVADVSPEQVPRWQAKGWVVGEPPEPEGKTITGLANTVWNPAAVVPDRAATEAQLAAVAAAGGGGAAIVLRAGQGISVTPGQTPLEYTIALDLSLVSASDNLTIKKENKP